MAEACAHYGVDGEELRRTKRGDLAKPSVAWRIWKETTVSQRWLAEHLDLKSPANASHVVRRFASREDRSLPRQVQKWKKIAKHVD